MRLDAAADSLLQTRDLLIRHLEQQMLQLQEVRAALHEAAREVEHAADATVSQGSSGLVASAASPVKPHGGLDLASLFAPLNALKSSSPAEVATMSAESASPNARVAVVDELVSEVPLVSAEVLFDAEPSPAVQWENPMREVYQGADHRAVEAEMAMASPTVERVAESHPKARAEVPLSMSVPSHEIDPALEKATLDELNEALTRAFAQIATRQAAH